MKKDNTVLSIKNYGHIEFTLKQQLDARNMTRNQLARAIDTRFEVVDKWYKNGVEKIDADILARICFVLACSVEDIIHYAKVEPNEK